MLFHHVNPSQFPDPPDGESRLLVDTDGNLNVIGADRRAQNIGALVSADGNLAYAAVASTTGTPGEVRKLSDGPNKGVALTWAIPEGSSTYAWCWQIYPLAAYL